MLNRKSVALSLLMVLLVTVLSGCMMGSVAVPDRDVEMSIDAALAAQDKAMAGLMAGNVEWTEGEFSSLVTELIKQNLGDGSPVSGVTAWFTPDKLYLQVGMADGSTVELAGNVMVENNRLMVDLTDAAAMGMSVSGPIMDVVSSAINRALDDPSLGVAVDVSMGDGTLSVALQ